MTSLGLLAGIAGVSGLKSAVAQQAATSPASDGSAARCTQLIGRQLGGATVDRAAFVAKGTVVAPFKEPVPFDFCRVEARTSSGPGSEIKLQMWLPSTWNGKFVGVGGGGFEGGYASAALTLRGAAAAGYAGVATNAGHDPAPEAKWALGNPQKIADYGHRANHLGAIAGKALVAAYYGTPATRAYFQGCSNGGRDALMLAQRYPQDYDAIAVGAPANDFTGLLTSFMWQKRLVTQPGINLSPAKIKALHDAAIGACDARDGVKDGLIEKPLACRFEPAALQCKPGNDGGECLTPSEAATVKSIYRGPVTRDGRVVFPGMPVGSEYEWGGWFATPKSAGPGLGRQLFRYMVYDDPAWDVGQFALERDYMAARTKMGPVLDAVNPDVRPFLKRGGKLLIYHGWDDAAIAAGNTLRYHAELRRTVGKAANDGVRLFMMPGVAHCAGGHGPDTFDYFGELDRWTETKRAPERIVATQGNGLFRQLLGLPTTVTRSRPLCAWPKTARYKGKGSIDEASSFECR